MEKNFMKQARNYYIVVWKKNNETSACGWGRWFQSIFLLIDNVVDRCFLELVARGLIF